jgi:hypothetical protein
MATRRQQWAPNTLSHNRKWNARRIPIAGRVVAVTASGLVGPYRPSRYEVQRGSSLNVMTVSVEQRYCSVAAMREPALPVWL